jgi:hypothetical protein
MGSFQCYFGKAIVVDCPGAQSSLLDAPQCLKASEHVSVFLLYYNFLLKYRIQTKLVSWES